MTHVSKLLPLYQERENRYVAKLLRRKRTPL